MDQTGVHLVPSAKWTYECVNRSSVAVVGAEDKRQITACLASAMDGTMLPLQLIFQGKTDRCLPSSTPLALSARVDITCSPNHWSSQQTMQRWVEMVLLPYTERAIHLHNLASNSKVLLVLDVWAVHKSEAFRIFLRTHHPHIHLVFIPANCTSKLQVADVALQRPFKHGIQRQFTDWAASHVRERIRACEDVSFNDMLKMSVLKSKALEWCINSWQQLSLNKVLVLGGWDSCVANLYNVHDPAKRLDALAAVHSNQLDLVWIPTEAEQDAPEESDGSSSSACESDSDPDELDSTRPRVFGERKSTRERKQPTIFGYQISSERVVMTEDSEC